MTDPKAKEIKDRILIRIRNPYNNQYIQKTFRYDTYGSKENAEDEAKRWQEETLNMLKEKNRLSGNTHKISTGPNPKKKLQNQIDSLSRHQEVLDTKSEKQVVDTTPRLKKKRFPYDKWIPNNTGASLCLVSKSKGGKTSFLKKILSNMPKDIITILITPNFQNDIYDSMSKRAIVSPVYDSRIIKLIQKINQKTKNHYRFCIILDDVIDQKNNSSLLKAFLTLRNANISVILSVQSTMLINKLVRNNCNHVLLGKLQGNEAIKDAYIKFLTRYSDELGVKKQDDIYKIYNQYTEDFGFIYVNNLKEKIYQTNKSL